MMTKQELKKKIMGIVDSANYCPYEEDVPCDGCEIKKEKQNNGLRNCLSVFVADALIEAGIGDVETLRKIGAHATAMAVLRAAKAEHRAEVAERALKLACKTIAPSYVDTAKLYFEIFVNQAEKELAEERNDEQD